MQRIAMEIDSAQAEIAEAESTDSPYPEMLEHRLSARRSEPWDQEHGRVRSRRRPCRFGAQHRFCDRLVGGAQAIESGIRR